MEIYIPDVVAFEALAATMNKETKNPYLRTEKKTLD